MAIFMIGTQRSGSNLLRLMLNQIPDIAAPHPPHVLQRMMPLLPAYGDLEEDSNFETLVEDVCRLVELNPVEWEGVRLDRQRVWDHCRSRTLMSVYEAVYDLMAQTWGAASWCCKSLANINYLSEIETHFDEAKYIYLFRDGRDVALSFRRAIVGEKHFYHIAQEWARTQRLAINHAHNIPAARFLSVSYEEITGAPEITMRRLCRFLGVRFADSMLNFHESTEATRAATSSDLWGNVAKPLLKNNTQKFLREADEKDIRIFEQVAGDVLDALGYERAFVKGHEKVDFDKTQVELFNKENQRLKDEIRQNTDAEDLERRDLQASLIKSIVARQYKEAHDSLSS